jgi:hypothetical protein
LMASGAEQSTTYTAAPKAVKQRGADPTKGQDALEA